ncbi:MAG: hypothetical protein HYS40_03360 [Gemmatimonadetes bacterium]|nr:hypothetical protein [Gemmatimonadota bacterium]
MIQHIDVHAVLQQSVAGYYADLVTRPTGRAVRESIETVLREAGEAAIARMDFSGVGCIDYSCADEIVAKLLREHGLVLLLRGISEGHREAIEPVLQGHGLAALCERADGTLDAIGPREAGAALLEELVARRVATRTPGGAFALTPA